MSEFDLQEFRARSAWLAGQVEFEELLEKLLIAMEVENV